MTNLEKGDSLGYQMMEQQSMFLITNYIITEQAVKEAGTEDFSRLPATMNAAPTYFQRKIEEK